MARLVNARQPAGQYAVTWNADGFSSGVYYYVIEAGATRESRSMVLVK